MGRPSPKSGMDITPGSPLHHNFTAEDIAKSHESRRHNLAVRKNFKEAALAFLATKPTHRKMRELLTALGVPETEQTKRDAITLINLTKAEAGDLKSAEFIYELTGEKVIRTENQNLEMKPLIDLTRKTERKKAKRGK